MSVVSSDFCFQCPVPILRLRDPFPSYVHQVDFFDLFCVSLSGERFALVVLHQLYIRALISTIMTLSVSSEMEILRVYSLLYCKAYLEKTVIFSPNSTTFLICRQLNCLP